MLRSFRSPPVILQTAHQIHKAFCDQVRPGNRASHDNGVRTEIQAFHGILRCIDMPLSWAVRSPVLT